MSAGTVTGGDHATLDPNSLAIARWLWREGAEAGADWVAAGQPVAPESIAYIVANNVARHNPRAAVLALHAVCEEVDRRGPLDPPDPGETQAETDERVALYLYSVIGAAARSTRQRLHLWDAPLPVVAKVLGFRPVGAPAPRRNPLLRLRPRRRRRSRVARCRSPGRRSEPDPPPVDDDACRFEAFRPELSPHERCELFGRLPLVRQDCFWQDLRERVEAGRA